MIATWGLDALATVRLTRLITRDKITARARYEWDARTLDGRLPMFLFDVTGCAWCVGIWVAAGVVTARRVCPRAWQPIAYGLALAEIAGRASA